MQRLTLHNNTNDIYRYQAITMVEWCRPLLEAFLKMRDMYVRLYAEKVKRKGLLSPTSWLFISSNFKQISASSIVSKFFKHRGFRLNTNLVRKIFESETEELVQNGKVSTIEQQSVHNIMGHSGATAKRSYIIPRKADIARQRSHDADVAGRVMSYITDKNKKRKPNIDMEEILALGKYHLSYIPTIISLI